MTTHELAHMLLDGPDVMAMIGGYEGGIAEIDGINSPSRLHLNVNTKWYYGPHELHTTTDCQQCKQGRELSAVSGRLLWPKPSER